MRPRSVTSQGPAKVYEVGREVERYVKLTGFKSYGYQIVTDIYQIRSTRSQTRDFYSSSHAICYELLEAG
ncbi:hypothetical protein J6590_083967, partial [Homalodisca vitripennis]